MNINFDPDNADNGVNAERAKVESVKLEGVKALGLNGMDLNGAVVSPAAPVCVLLPEAETFFDDSMLANRKTAFARHLSSCAICTQELAELARVRRMVMRLPKSPIQVVWKMRGTDFLREARRNANYNAVLRIAGGAVGVAAAVLLATGIWSGAPAKSTLPQSNYATASAANGSAAWESAVLGDNNATETADSSGADVSQAQWVVKSLDGGSTHD